MDPKQLLVDVMSGIWNFAKANDYFYVILAVVVIVVIWKVIKVSAKTVFKVGIALLVIFLAKKFLGL